MQRAGARAGDGDAPTGFPPLIAPDAGTDAGTYTGAGYVALTGTAASGGSGSFTYLWTVAGGTLTNATNLTTATFKPTAAGGAQVVTLTATDTVTGLTAQDTVTINVPALVAPDAGTDSGSWTDTTISLDGTAATGGAGTITHVWTKVTGLGTPAFGDSTAVDTTMVPSLPSSYQLRLTGTDAIGQAANDTVTINATLATVMGALFFGDYWAADRDNEAAVNPRITIVTGVSNWPEEATRNAAAVQAVGTLQPVLSATSFGGKPGVTFDGSNDALVVTLSPSIADTGRVYVWLVANWTGAPAGDFRRGYEFADVALNNILTLNFTSVATGKYGWLSVLDGTDDVVQNLTNDTARHVFEAGTPASTSNKYLRDGSAENGSGTGGVDAAVTRLIFANSANLTAAGPLCMHRMIIAHNPSSISAVPSATVTAWVRNYLGTFI